MGAEDVMPLPDDVSGCVEEVASGWDAVVKGVMGTQVARDRSDGVPGWIGEDADAYTGSIKRLGERARGLGQCLMPASETLRTWGAAVRKMITTTVPDFWERYNEAYRVRNRGLDDLEARIRAGEVLTPVEQEIEMTGLENALIKTIDGIVAEYKAAMDGLDDDAQTAATAIQNTLNTIVDPSLQGSRNRIGATLFNDIPVVDGQAEWEQAQELAPRIAERIKDPNLTPEELQAFHDEYGSLLSNPFVANALGEVVTPQQMVEFSIRVKILGNRLSDVSVGDEVNRQIGTAMVLASGGMNTDPTNIHDQTCFETAKKGLIANDGNSVANCPASFAESMKSAGRVSYRTWGAEEIGGYGAMLQLMGEAGKQNKDLALGADFFNSPSGGLSVAQDLVAWNATSKLWNTSDGYAQIPSLFHVKDDSLSDPKVGMRDPLHAMYTLMDRPESLVSAGAAESLVELPEGNEGQVSEKIDPTLRDADIARLDSIRGFLNSNTPEGVDAGIPGKDMNHDNNVDGKDKVTNMTRYLTGWRQSAYPSSPYFGFQDGGEQFGKVIQQASIPEKHMSLEDVTDEGLKKQWWERDEQIKRIAGNFMFGYQDGLEHPAALPGKDEHDGQRMYGYTNSRLRSWAGVIMSPHMEDVTISMKDPKNTNDVVGGGDDRHQITFSSNMRGRLLKKAGFFTDLGFDNPAVNDNGTPDDTKDDYYEGGRAPAIDNLLIAAKAGYEDELHEAAKNKSWDQAEQVSSKWAPAMEALFTAPADANEQTLRALNERNARWQKFISAGIGAIPIAGDLAKGEYGGWIADQARSNGTASVLEAFLPTNNENADALPDAKDMTEEYMSSAIYQEMSTQGDFPAAGENSPGAYSGGSKGSKYSLVREDGLLKSYSEMKPEEKDLFERFIAEKYSDYAEVHEQNLHAIDLAKNKHDEARTR
ncbi:hypothetical protein FBF34_03505 [Arachnia propionica]|uniref:WXG100 family type VII secretion target n=1 Tax=Arachnia propionica TaxID=1750 RepID=A0AB37HS52_9ACTN|nr:hypothetical protein [Arachnia propionica]AFN45948.1 hypothetical protein HMPREF9154_0738 [Arachnia propionica F0230a]QCT37144.1 hypothetical protein FBF34_03505 [Arachnia propionica]QUC10515.1 hypothetical protein J5A53_12115 [Arachnia propionica]RPA17406.1 hypothetical protein EGT56_05065 [Arachnia propionica]